MNPSFEIEDFSGTLISININYQKGKELLKSNMVKLLEKGITKEEISIIFDYIKEIDTRLETIKSLVHSKKFAEITKCAITSTGIIKDYIKFYNHILKKYKLT